MENNNVYVFDIEADGLLDTITKIHCLSITEYKTRKSWNFTSYEDIKKFFLRKDKVLIGHNIYLYDIPAVEKVLGIKVNYEFIVDTLAVSQYIHSSKPSSYKHGLESYGERFGVPKPKIDDWENLSVEEYIHRCSEDVKINIKLWEEQEKYLIELYEGNGLEVKRFLNYINSKLDVLKEQQENPIPLNIELVNSEISRLEQLVEEKRQPLLEAMPKQPIKVKANKPKVMYKADGTLSVAGNRWLELEQEYGSGVDDVIEYVKSYEEPNPDSTTQLKDWLLSLGWKPQHFKFVRNKQTNEFKQVAQIKSEYDDTDICQSVKDLIEVEPAIEHLASYSTIKHRITIYKGFLRDINSDNTITAEAGGFTNTMRLKHRRLVNLPKPSAPYAENIRACLISGNSRYMVGSDLSGIEDATKQHYIYPIDPEYVDSMRREDWDAHTNIAVLAGLMTLDEEKFFKEYGDIDSPTKEQKELYSNLKQIRQSAKTVNFSATYGVGVKTLARSMKTTDKKAKPILDAYWKRNHSVKQFAASCTTKVIDGQMWVKQPINNFWYTLRSEKDVFSTVNQSSAVYVFDVWLAYLRKLDIKVSAQFHDEWIGLFDNTVPKDEVRSVVNRSIELVNNKLKLNVPINCSLDFGKSYSEVH